MNSSDIKFNRIIKACVKDMERLSPVDWAEKYRFLTSDISRFTGKLSYNITPYVKEIINSFMNTDPAQVIAVQKGSQLGLTVVGLITLIGWIISQSPERTLFITENDEKIKDQMQNQISPMINSSGLAHLVGTHRMRNREAMGRRNLGSGDTLKGMKFNDGVLYTHSGQKMDSLSSWSIKYGLYDEVDLWKGNYANAGSAFGLVEPRHKSYMHDRKLLFISTPLTKLCSNINPIYLWGDQRKYTIPCEHCGELVELVWSELVNGEYAGIHYKTKNGLYVEGSAGYVCQKCGGFFKETHKYDVMEQDLGEWKPTAEPLSYIYKSYHISSLYTPMGFYNWEFYARRWCEIHPKDSPVLLNEKQTFYNQTLGLVWEEESKKIDTNKITNNCRNYKHTEIPFNLSMKDGNGEIVMLTATVDLNGKMGETVEEDDVRLDYEVVAWCRLGGDSFVTCYSIDHGSIGNFERARHKERNEKKGIVNQNYKKYTYRPDYENSVWKEFDDLVMNRDYFTEDGRAYKVLLCGVDTGNFTVYANDYVAKQPRSVALKGSEGKYMADDKALYRKGNAKNLFIVNGTIVKDRLAQIIEMQWSEKDGKAQPIGFKNFPKPCKEEKKYTYQDFFIEYEGEEKKIKLDRSGKPIGMIWQRIGDSRNHFWDCAAYQLVIKDIAVNILCENYKFSPTWENMCKILIK